MTACARPGCRRDERSQVGQLVEQRLSLFQIERVEAFGEPAVDRSEQIAGLLPLALIAPEPRHAHCRAQFPGLCLLLTRDSERTLEICLRFRSVRLGDIKSDFAGNAIISASNHVSLVVSTAVIASPMQRQASSNWPSSAYALAKYDTCKGIHIC